MNNYKTFPKGYKKLANKIIPIYMRPMKKLMMKLLVRIISEG